MAHFVDTNILLYAVSGDPGEVAKQAVASRVLEGDCMLSVQVLQEFFVQAARPGRSRPMPDLLAEEFIRTWLRFPVVELAVPVMQRALEIRRRHRLSCWDAAILAAAEIGGCDSVMTEDLSHGQIINGIRIVNPFLEE